MPTFQSAIFVSVLVGSLLISGLAGWINQPITAKAEASGNSKLEIPTKVLSAKDSNQQSSSASGEEPKPQDKTSVQEQTDNCPLSSAFPETIQQWCSPIKAASETYNLDANLIAAVMLQESGGNPQAYSSAGAVGLLQIMPRDGIAASFQCINGPCFANRPTTEQLLDPAFNIDYGSRMLSGLTEKHGSIRDGLLYYGPTGMGYGYADKVLAIYNNYH
jgi:hypothetical protein